MHVLEVKNLTAGYDGTVALRDVTFKVPEGSLVTIIGPNGSGKTTLLRSIMGILKPLKGEVKVFGVNIMDAPLEVKSKIGYVPQREMINTELPVKVRDIVLMGRMIHKGVPRIPSDEDIRKAKEALRMVGIENLWDKPFTMLSGGQQQRVLFARCCASEAKLMLLDEPFSAVDPRGIHLLADLIEKAKKEYGATILIVTHDINPMIEKTDYIMVLDGKLVSYGRPLDVLKKEILETVYGPVTKILREGAICYTITGDRHA